MKNYIYSELTQKEKVSLTQRPSISFEKSFDIVRNIIEEVKQNGFDAVKKFSEKYDKFSGSDFKVSQDEINNSEYELDEELKSAIDNAYSNIYEFHKNQIPCSYSSEVIEGINCRREFRPIENVGLYIPGGTAVLPSTMLMLGIPAKIAGCSRVVAISPTKENIHPAILYSAKICNVSEFYKVGGAHGIALLAYGAKEIKKVDKIFGPGNQYVTAAKMLASIDSKGCAIDMPAGPSEVLIIADSFANPAYVAADLLSQAEHGIDSQVVLLSNSGLLIQQVNLEIKNQLNNLPRKEYAEKALNNSFSVKFETLDEAMKFSNEYAPEHLIINCENSEILSNKVVNAGSVFLGQYSPESAGDYASGTNHSLPTYGFVKAYSGVSVESFMKSITFQNLSKDGLKNISKTVIKLAETEKLEAHANAVKIRIKDES